MKPPKAWSVPLWSQKLVSHRHTELKATVVSLAEIPALRQTCALLPTPGMQGKNFASNLLMAWWVTSSQKLISPSVTIEMSHRLSTSCWTVFHGQANNISPRQHLYCRRSSASSRTYWRVKWLRRTTIVLQYLPSSMRPHSNPRLPRIVRVKILRTLLLLLSPSLFSRLRTSTTALQAAWGVDAVGLWGVGN